MQIFEMPVICETTLSNWSLESDWKSRYKNRDLSSSMISERMSSGENEHTHFISESTLIIKF